MDLLSQVESLHPVLWLLIGGISFIMAGSWLNPRWEQLTELWKQKPEPHKEESIVGSIAWMRKHCGLPDWIKTEKDLRLHLARNKAVELYKRREVVIRAQRRAKRKRSPARPA